MRQLIRIVTSAGAAVYLFADTIISMTQQDPHRPGLLTLLCADFPAQDRLTYEVTRHEAKRIAGIINGTLDPAKDPKRERRLSDARAAYSKSREHWRDVPNIGGWPGADRTDSG